MRHLRANAGCSVRRALIAAAAFLLAGCTTTSTVHPVSPTHPTERGNSEAIAPASASAPHCGLERWPVKTGSDTGAAQVDLNAVHPTTIAALTALPVPAGFSQDAGRLPPVEDTVYKVTATLREYKQEADSDFHLVLADAQGHTMVAEIPSPACTAPSSPFLPGITKARTEFDARYAPGDFWQPANVSVQVTGIGFFDVLHGQTGVAPNGVELHPVLDITFGS